MRFDSELALTILGVAIALVQPEIALSLTGVDVSQKAKEITVIINGTKKLGSGVIISRQADIYYVLTNWHVMDGAGTYTVQTSDKREYLVNSSLVARLPGVDLAVFQFNSSRKYSFATIGNSDAAKEGTTVYVSGAPEPVLGIPQRTVLIPKGAIVGKKSPPQDGYALIYDNNTYPGMSGGAVLDENGRLIGIHGQGARDKTDGQKVGFNLGIPINTFMQSNIARNLGLVVDNSQIVVQPPPIPSSVPTGRPPKIPGSDGAGDVTPGTKY